MDWRPRGREVSAPTLGSGPPAEGAIELDLDRDGDTLLVTFGGIQQGMGGIPPFEFRRITEGLRAKLVYVRDPAQSWYHGVLPGIGRGLPALQDAVAGALARSGASRLVCIGNSMGGYAALVVGSALGADRVLSFSPQTFLSRWLRMWYRERRWEPKVGNAWRSDSAVRAAFDLRRYLARPNWGDATVFADSAHRLDRIHAMRVSSLPRLRTEWVEGGGHALVRILRDSGALEAVLRQACGNGQETRDAAE
jgi:hypothetical protein